MLSLIVSASGRPGARNGDVISPSLTYGNDLIQAAYSGTTSINPVVDIAMLLAFIIIFPFTANRLYRKFNVDVVGDPWDLMHIGRVNDRKMCARIHPV